MSWWRRWERAQLYSLQEVMDSEGDIVWFLIGPGLELVTYSHFQVREALLERNVDYEGIRFLPARASSAAWIPQDGGSA